MSIWTGARAVRTGQVFLVWKEILEFSAGPSGWENLSVWTASVRTLTVAFRTII